jgi:hypothetical protein
LARAGAAPLNRIALLTRRTRGYPGSDAILQSLFHAAIEVAARARGSFDA